MTQLNYIDNLEEEHTIILLDGRKVTIPIFRKSYIENHDKLEYILHFDAFCPTIPMHHALAITVLNLLSTHSITYVSNILLSLTFWLNIKESPLDIIKINDLLTFQELKPHSFPFISSIVNRFVKLHPEYFDKDCNDFLVEPIKWEQRHPAYFKLLANDPVRGALTIQELNSIQSALNKGFTKNKISESDYTLCWFFLATGIRPVQASRLKLSDIQIIDQDVMIKIPLAKAEGTIDQGYMLKKAPSSLAQCLIRYLNNKNTQNLSEQVFNLNPKEISKRIRNIFNELDTYSSRLENKIPVNSYRFRYTLATRAIVQGASDLEVARLLTHRSTSCIQFYRASLPDLQKPIHEALNEEIGFFAKAFQGKLITSLDDASIKNSAIYDFFHLHGKTVGACGTHAKCYQNAPISCLTCSFFEPLTSAPWPELLEILKKDQAGESEIRIKEINQAAINALSEIISRSSAEGL